MNRQSSIIRQKINGLPQILYQTHTNKMFFTRETYRHTGFPITHTTINKTPRPQSQRGFSNYTKQLQPPSPKTQPTRKKEKQISI